MHMHDCQQIADELDVPVENILGLAASESGYGQSRISTELDNYFSMRSPAPGQIGTEPARGDPKVILAKYPSFLESVRSFAFRYGPAVRGKKDPWNFAQALVMSGFNSGNSKRGGTTTLSLIWLAS